MRWIVFIALGCLLIWAGWPQTRSSVQAADTVQAADESRKPAAPVKSLIGRTIADFSLLRTDGTQFKLSDRKEPVLVAVFLGVECPLANLYFQRLVELANLAAGLPVAAVVINSNEQDTLPEVREQAQRHGATFPVLKDPGNKVADLFGATRTPECFVLDAERKVRYHGRIDDQYGFNFKRSKPTQTDLLNAVQALLASKPVPVPETPVEGCRIGRKRKPREKAEVTFHRDVLPILQNRCQQCHRRGELAPFDLAEYADVSNWAETIKEVVEARRMPPWLAHPEHGTFVNDASLPAEELSTLVRWVDQGAPEGDARQAPSPPQWQTGWNIGEPDAVFTMPTAFQVSTQGTIDYQHVAVSEVFTEDKWVQAVECRAGNPAVVHHILALLHDPTNEKQSQNGLRGGFFAAAAPGTMFQVFPPGQAKKIPKGSQLVLQLHYTANGTAQEDRSKVGVIYSKEPPQHEIRTYALADPKFKIPPGDGDYTRSRTITLPVDLEITELFPHLHLRGKSFEFRAKYPAGYENGREQVLLQVPRWDFNWQLTYRFQQPLKLPRGTQLTIKAVWDNSAGNPNNPDHRQSVGWGDQTWNEMFVGYANYIVPAELAAIERLQGTRKYPAVEARPATRVTEKPAAGQ